MIRNYFKIAWRNVVKNKLFSLINIAGLAIGISSALVIYLIVSYDLSFEKFEKDGDRVYRVVADYTFSGEAFHAPGVQSAMPAAVRNEVTGIDEVVPMRLWHEDLAKISVANDNNTLTPFKNQNKIVLVDHNYFSFLNYKWVAGSPNIALEQPYQVVLTESKAKTYFPNTPEQDIVGRQLVFNDSIRTTVTGIVQDIKQNTDFTFEVFVSKSTIETPRLQPDKHREWVDAYPEMQLLVKLSANSDAKHVEEQINAVYKKYHKGDSHGTTTKHRLQPLNDLHFNSQYGNFNQRLAHRPTLYGLLAVGGFLILLACINFINLNTAQASQRAKEIGVRKVMGSSGRQLIAQFLSETFALALMATLLSIVLTPVLLKIFADFIPQGLHFDLINQPDVLIYLAILIAVVTLLSGFYPAIILSSYKPVEVLKKSIGTNRQERVWLRKSLSIFQFVIAQVFIIATILVNKQIKYSLTQDLGFKKDAIVYFETSWKDADVRHRLLLMDKLKALPEVKMISLSNNTPSSLANRGNTLTYNDGKTNRQVHVKTKLADTNYIHVYQMQLLAGTNLPQSDTIGSILINETCAHNLGFMQAQQAAGKYADLEGKKVPIVGVIKDFHQGSFHEEIKPVIISSKVGDQLTFNISLQNTDGGTWVNAIDQMKKDFHEVFPDDDFDYHFLDDSIAKYYTAEQNISRLLIWVTGICIFISCLGLFGLVIYITNQRTKEIGIRKVIGASVSQIVMLLSEDFLKLVLLSFAIATPIAWYGASRWLQNFAYKTHLNWWIFLLGGSAMFLIALLVLSMRTVRAAMANPVRSLRSE